MMQKVSARPVFSEHSFVTWRFPLRGYDADAEDANADGARAGAVRDTIVAPTTSRRVGKRMKPLIHLSPQLGSRTLNLGIIGPLLCDFVD
jgi:hypothetical protein